MPHVLKGLVENEGFAGALKRSISNKLHSRDDVIVAN